MVGIKWFPLTLLIGVLLAACGGGSGGSAVDNTEDGGNPPPPPNGAPAVTTVHFQVKKNTDLSTKISVQDPENDSITFSQVSEPVGGKMMAFTEGGEFTYRPKADADYFDVFTVVASDGTNEVTTSITLKVGDSKGWGEAPEITTTKFEVQWGENLTATLMATDFEGNAVTFTKITEPAFGQVDLQTSGDFTYQPADGFKGSDGFIVAASDGLNAVNAIIFIDVTRKSQQLAFSETGPLTLDAGDTHTNQASGVGSGKVIYSSSDPAVAAVNQQGLVTAGIAGTATIFAYMKADSDYFEAEASYDITVNPVDPVFKFTIDSPPALVVGNTLNNPARGSGSGDVSYGSDKPGVAQVNDAGQVTAIGVGQAKITASKKADSRYLAATASYTLTVVPPNLAPAITSTEFGVEWGRELWATLTATDPEGDLVTFTKIQSGSTVKGGQVDVDSTGNFKYKPADGFTGNDRFSVVASDGANTVNAIIAVGVIPRSQSLEFDESGPLTLVFGDTRTNQATGSGVGKVTYWSDNTDVAVVNEAGLVSAVMEGTAKISAHIRPDSKYFEAEASYDITVNTADPNFKFTINSPPDLAVGETWNNPAGGLGSGEITYSSDNPSVAEVNGAGEISAMGVGAAKITAEKAADKQYAAATASYTITVVEPNEAPVITATEFEVEWGRELGATLTATDPESNPVTFTEIQNGSTVKGGQVNLDTAGNFTYQPASGFKGNDHFIAAASDGVNTVNSTIFITVTRRSQTLEFDESGPLTLEFGDTYTNQVRGSGVGKVTYWSDNIDVAVVNQAGLVSGVKDGKVTIYAHITSDADYFTAEASYEITFNPLAGIEFGQPGPLSLFVGKHLENNAGVVGSTNSYKFFYISDNANVAKIENPTSGMVEVVGVGSARITAHREVDGLEASYIIHSAEPKVPIAAWMGTNNTEVNFPQSAVGAGLDFYRSSEPSCDLLNINNCENGRVDILYYTGPTVVDTAATLGRPGFYTLEHGDKQASLQISSSDSLAPMGRAGHQIVVFPDPDTGEDILWLIGGRTTAGYKNDVWSSSDGINWVLRTEHAAFSARTYHQVAVFPDPDTGEDKLWLTGGVSSSALFGIKDIWFSSDGTTWEQAIEGGKLPFPGRYEHQLVVFDEKLWVIGGAGKSEKLVTSILNDVWYSEDGVTWQSKPAATLPARAGHQVVVFPDPDTGEDKLWLIGGANGVPALSYHQDVWSSGDGDTWTLRTGNSGFSSRLGHRVVVFPDPDTGEDKLWLVGGNNGSQMKDVWTSSDGVNWVPQTHDALFSNRSAHQLVVYGNYLWMIGGVSGSSLKYDAWRMGQNLEWRMGVHKTFNFE